MNEKFLESFNLQHASKLIQFGAVVSIIMGIVLVVCGLIYKKKGKTWWIYLVLLGIVSIVTNYLQIA